MLLLAALSLPAATPVESLTFNGQVDTNQASFMLTGRLKGQGTEELDPKLIYSLAAKASVSIEKEVILQRCELTAKIHQGRLKELVLAMRGDGEVTNVAGPNLKDWSVRLDAQGKKFLVIRPTDPATNTPPPKEFTATVTARHPFKKLPVDFSPLNYVPENAALFDGSLEIKPNDAVELALTNVVGLMLVREERALNTATQEITLSPNQPFQFRFSGGDYSLAVQVRERDADGRKVSWEKFQLIGELKDRKASFTLTGEAVVKHPEGGTLAVLAGEAALTSYPTNAELKFEGGRYLLRFRQPGTYPIELKFDARVTLQSEWNNVSFDVVSSSLRPVTLKGLPSDTQFQFVGAAKPDRQGEDFVSFLPSAGRVQLQWKEAKKEELGKLFYSVQGTVHMSVGSGLLRQTYLMDYKVMQGELTQLVFDLVGEGEVTRVPGNGILSWKIEPGANNQRRLIVLLSQPRKDSYQVMIQTQTPLGVFPLKIQPLQLTPVQAIRYGGYLVVVNDGAVKLEVTEAKGLSQISPELFPQSKELLEAGVARGTQAFAYRFSGGDYSLALQADHILPELSVSQLLVYHVGETETIIDAEIELEIRDAPLREFTVRIPSDFTNPRVNAPQLSDFPVTPEAGTGFSKMRIVFSSPLTGRQVIQVRLSKNTNAVAGAWTLPVIQPQGVKSVRGQVGVSSETGFRLTAGRVTGLTEIAPAFFQRKITGLQLAWRLREEAWDAVVNVERLALTVQADVLHLFTLKESIVYGSSVMNYLISGAPVNQLRVAVPDEYTNNVEFAGKDVRNWKKTPTGYEVYFNTPVYGAYTLLATYDHQFNTRTNSTASFEGARPLEVQTEHGSVLVVSEFQFEVKPVEVSPNLLKLDPVEVPPEHRLLFDAPILAAYQYIARPFTLRLALSSLPPGDTMHQVADRALLVTQISREGEVLTTATYFLKNQGHSHLRVTLPPQTDLWEARVNGLKVMPVTDGAVTLIPLPAKADPTAVLTNSLKLASKSDVKKLVKLTTPALGAPVLQTEWQLKPDEQYRLHFSSGGVAPVELQRESSGFIWIKQAIGGQLGDDLQMVLLVLPVLLLVGVVLFRWATRESVYRWSASNIIGLILGLVACGAAIVFLVGLALTAGQHPIVLPTSLTFIAPVQAAGQSLDVVVKNLPVTSRDYALMPAWPAIVAVLLWIYLAVKGVEGGLRKFGVMAGWTLAAWAALRTPNGAAPFLWLLVAFIIVHLLIPALRCQFSLRPKPPQPKPPEAPEAPAPETGPATALLILGMLLAGSGLALAAEKPEDAAKSVVQSIVQQGQVEEGFVRVKAQLVWKTEAGQRLDFLSAPAVLTKVNYSETALTLTETKTGEQSVYRLTAKSAGTFEISFEYQLTIPKETMNNSFWLPTPHGLVNRLSLEIDRPEVEVFSSDAVSVETTRPKRGDREITRAELVLAPQPRVQVSWRPRARDPRLEKAVFFGDLYHLYIPTPGVVEGWHLVQVKPAQGQLSEVAFTVPTNLTITDVQGDMVSNWRFDPDQKLLRVQFSAPQPKPFTLKLRSQLATGTLPYEQTVGVITLSQAEGQLGMAGVATGPEVSLDTVKEQGLSMINLEDFPAALMAEAARQIPALALRRAYRYADATARITLSASAVQPEVRVETQETLSLGEDRTVLASQLAVDITRAGIFKLTFELPKDFEVESLTGAALSHWTESKVDTNRLVTLHLRGKTEGRQAFSITLAGPGLANKTEWEAPRLTLREATRQAGQLVIVPEQGIRLQVKTREGLTLLDPKRAGITQKGVMAFRLLQPRWQLTFDVETVEPWIQAASLQDVSLREGQAQVGVNLDYQIENAGVKTFVVQVPAVAENVRFESELLSDFVKLPGATNRWLDWEVKLQRRVIGNYSLRVTYQLPITNQATELRISGVKARTASLQRGFLAVRAGGRLQLKFPPIPASLQPAEWQSIPASLRRGKDMAESKDCFSILEGDFELVVGLTRHEVAKLLAAQVESLSLTSVISPSGEMLTEGRLLLQPGDLRLLSMKLPPDSKFWYAFVNGQSAWPWRQGGQILLLLEKNSEPNKPTTVEFFYTCQTEGQSSGGFTHQVLGPSFNLPLQNISWDVYVPAIWQVKKWESSLQLRSQGQTLWPSSINLDAYIQTETARLQQKTKEAENLMRMGNEFLQGGAPQQARRAYQAAWRMSPQDAAFNEDARVQFNNVKMQQALLGLNQARQAAFEYAEKKSGKTPSPFTRVEPGQAPDYTQQQAQQILEQNPKEENDALIRLAERLIRQQSAGGGKPESIRAALPLQGRLYNFTGSLQVKQWADLNVKLAVKSEITRPWTAIGLFLGGLFVVLLVLGFIARDPSRMGAE